MKTTAILTLALLTATGCTAVDTVTDAGVKLQVSYCGLTAAGRRAVALKYHERLPPGYGIDVDCPGDLPD